MNWNNWGRGNFEKANAKNISNIGNVLEPLEKKKFYDKISFKEDVDYLELFESIFKNEINEILKNFFGTNNFDYWSNNELKESDIQNNANATFTFKYNKELFNIDVIRKNLYLYNKILLIRNNGFRRFQGDDQNFYRHNCDEDEEEGEDDCEFFHLTYNKDMNRTELAINSNNTGKNFVDFFKQINELKGEDTSSNRHLVIYGNSNDVNFHIGRTNSDSSSHNSENYNILFKNDGNDEVHDAGRPFSLTLDNNNMPQTSLITIK